MIPARPVARGFSLLELLVVVAILALLAVLVVAGVDRLRARAHSATCASQLRQLGVAFFHYAAEHNQVLPPSRDENLVFWEQTLLPYIEYQRKILVCPERPLPITRPPDHANPARTYSVNQLAFGEDPRVDDPRGPVRLTNIQRPGDVILLADGVQMSAYQGSSSGRLYAPPFTQWSQSNPLDDPVPLEQQVDRDDLDEGRIRFRHLEAANTLRADGRVVPMRKGDLLYRHIYPTR